MSTQTVQTRRFSRQDYERLVAEGFFHPEERLELVDGELIMMTPTRQPACYGRSLGGRDASILLWCRL